MNGKNLRSLVFVFFFVVTAWHATAQRPNITTKAIFDTVYDRFGNSRPLSDLLIDGGKLSSGQILSIATTCTAGHFQLHFESGSFFDIYPASQAVACQVFSYISSFLPSNIGSGKIHIKCGSVNKGLGNATSYYVYPGGGSSAYPGMLDGQVYKAIVSGVDPYMSIPASFAQANSFFHGEMNVNPAYGAVFNYSLNTTAIGTSEFDLFTLILHEAYHAIGFASLIGPNGTSQLWPNNYYSRYDRFLHDHTGAPLLSTTLTGCAPINLIYSPSTTSVITPSMCVNTSTTIADVTNCSVAVQYSGAVTVTVYTPDCWESGSSLSHFEDMCSHGSFTTVCTPTPAAPGYNNLYFVMSNANATGTCYVKRHPTEEERKVLCDLGYSVNASFGGTATAGSSKTYTASSCSPSTVWGLNDGLNQGVYTFTTLGASITIPDANVLANDNPVSGTSVTCLQSLFSTATVSPGSGNFTVLAPQGSGLQIIKYIPQNGSIQGNVVYVFVYFVSPGCSLSNNCELIENGGFECLFSGPGCGSYASSVIDGWSEHVTVYGIASNLITTNCGSSTSAFGTLFGGSPVSTLNIGAQVNTRATMLTMSSGANSSIENLLKGSLIPQHSYQLSFWIVNHGSVSTNSIINPSNNPVVFSIATHSSSVPSSTLHYPAGLDVINDFTVNAGYSWTQITHTFVYTPTVAANYFFMGINYSLTPAGNYFYHCLGTKCRYRNYRTRHLQSQVPPFARPMGCLILVHTQVPPALSRVQELRKPVRCTLSILRLCFHPACTRSLFPIPHQIVLRHFSKA